MTENKAATEESTVTEPDSTRLSRIMAPRSVAIVGASDRQGNRGGTAAALLRKFGFAGAVYPVHPTAETVAGHPAVRNIADLPGDVDLAIIGLGAANVAGIIRELAAAGVTAVITWAGGFAENGAEGAQLQRDVAEAVAATGIRMLGPNCLGVVNTSIGFTGTFATWLRRTDALVTSGISMVSQSGGLAAAAHSWSNDAGVGLRFMVSTGNEVDVSVVDVLDYFIEDEGTKVILAYLEGVRDGARFTDALRRAREAGKPVILLKVGHSAASAKAIAAHTGTLAGETRVWDALLAAEGAIQVHSVEQMLELASYQQSRLGRPAISGNRIVLIGYGGGSGVLAADQAGFAGLDVVSLGAQTRAKLKALVPEIASVANPIDLTPEAFNQDKWRALVGDALRVIDESGEADLVVTQFSTGELVFPEEVTGPVIELHRSGRMAVAAYSKAAGPRAGELYAEAGLHTFDNQKAAIDTLGLIARSIPRRRADADRIESGARALANVVAAFPVPSVGDGAVIAEHEVNEMLEAAGVPTLRGRAVVTRDAAVAAAEEFGYPVVMKALSEKITHRAAAGLVRLNVESRAEVERAYDELVARTASLDADLLGVMVEEMANGGTELLVSAFKDPVFGLVISAGAGGVLTELIDDIGFARAPLTEESALRLLDGLRITDHPKGAALASVGSVATAFLVQFSRFAEALPWKRFVIELNPVLVNERRAIPLDGLLIVEDSAVA